MKHFLLSITLCLIYNLCEAQLKLNLSSHIKYEVMLRQSAYVDRPLTGNILEEVTEHTDNLQAAANEAISTANELPFVNIDSIQGISNINDWANRKREVRINRYLVGATGSAYIEGIELIGSVDVGYSNTNILSVGVNASANVNIGIIEMFGAELPTLELGTFTTVDLSRSLSVGYRLSASSESLYYNKQVDNSIDVSARLFVINDRSRRDKHISLSITQSFYTTPNVKSLGSFRATLAYQFSK